MSKGQVLRAIDELISASHGNHHLVVNELLDIREFISEQDEDQLADELFYDFNEITADYVYAEAERLEVHAAGRPYEHLGSHGETRREMVTVIAALSYCLVAAHPGEEQEELERILHKTYMALHPLHASNAYMGEYSNNGINMVPQLSEHLEIMDTTWTGLERRLGKARQPTLVAALGNHREFFQIGMNAYSEFCSLVEQGQATNLCVTSTGHKYIDLADRCALTQPIWSAVAYANGLFCFNALKRENVLDPSHQQFANQTTLRAIDLLGSTVETDMFYGETFDAMASLGIASAAEHVGLSGEAHELYQRADAIFQSVVGVSREEGGVATSDTDNPLTRQFRQNRDRIQTRMETSRIARDEFPGGFDLG